MKGRSESRIGSVSQERLLRLSDSEEDFDERLRVLGEVEQVRDLTPRELVLKARCVQLGGGASNELLDAKQALMRALDLDPDYLPALVDLGYFHSVVLDEEAQAQPYFERAIELAAKYQHEAMEGLEDFIHRRESEAD